MGKSIGEIGGLSREWTFSAREESLVPLECSAPHRLDLCLGLGVECFQFIRFPLLGSEFPEGIGSRFRGKPTSESRDSVFSGQ
jgi:hypothetical protein